MGGSSVKSTNKQNCNTPLYVDLDGTLVATDTLWEALLSLARQRPSELMQIPIWLFRGRATLKARLAERVPVRAELLPYRSEVVDYVRQARAMGRRTVLTTASNRVTAEAVAAHLELFDHVLASDGSLNLSGKQKLRAIRGDTPAGDFEYLGNSTKDVPMWRDAGGASLVAPSTAAAAAVRRLGIPRATLVDRESWLLSAFRALRPHQWTKNLLLFVPLLLAHRSEPGRVLDVGLAFFMFCGCASATYLLNDLLDIDADRRHPQKRRRPFALGTLPIPIGLALLAGLLTASIGASIALLTMSFTAMLAAYVLLTTAYSFCLKETLVLDVLVLAGLYTHRVLAGGIAADVAISPWLLAFSMFIFLSLAFVKRHVELVSARSADRSELDRRGYRVDDIGLVETMGLASGYVAVLVIGLYVSSDEVTRFYATPELLWLMCPVMLYWITRIWFLAHRGEVSEDPVLFASRDRVSYACGALMLAIGALATL